MKTITAFKTEDGKYFESSELAKEHELEIYQTDIRNKKIEIIRERLKKSIYGHIFEKHGARRATNVLPDAPLTYVLLDNTELVKSIISEIENIK